MVKKDNKFILYHLKILFIILINIIIFIIPTKTVSASTLPLINVPLDRWIYPAISRLETLQAFEGNSTIALNTTPLTRYKIAYLIDSALSNVSYVIPMVCGNPEHLCPLYINLFGLVDRKNL